MNSEALKEQEISGALLKENARLRHGIERILGVVMASEGRDPSIYDLLDIKSLCTKLLAGEEIE